MSPVLLLATLGAVAVGIVLDITTGPGRIVNPFLPVIVGTALLYAVLGHLVARRYAGHPVARVLQFAGLLGAVVVLAGGHANAALFGPLPDAGATFTLWLSRWMWVPAIGVAALGMLLLFPDGRLPSPRWRPAAGLRRAGAAPARRRLRDTAVRRHRSGGTCPSRTRSRSSPRRSPPPSSAVAYPSWVAGGRGGRGGRRAAPAEGRREGSGDRYALVVCPGRSAALRPAGQLARPRSAASPRWRSPPRWPSPSPCRCFATACSTSTSSSTGRRCTVCSCVSLFGAYVTVVALASAVVGGDAAWPAGAVAAVVVAALTGPLLSRLRTGVDRLMYGDRGRPDAVAGRLAVATSAPAATPAGSDVLGAAARGAARRACACRGCGSRSGTTTARRASRGPRATTSTIRLRGERLGRLLVGRPVGRRAAAPPPTTGARRRGPAARGHRRGLPAGPPAGRGPRTPRGCPRGRTPAHPPRPARRPRPGPRRHHRRPRGARGGGGAPIRGAAAAALPELRAQARAAVGDVRRLVDGLRPPALDELGLVGALAEELTRLERATGVRCTLDAPDRLAAAARGGRGRGAADRPRGDHERRPPRRARRRAPCALAIGDGRLTVRGRRRRERRCPRIPSRASAWPRCGSAPRRSAARSRSADGPVAERPCDAVLPFPPVPAGGLVTRVLVADDHAGFRAGIVAAAAIAAGHRGRRRGGERRRGGGARGRQRRRRRAHGPVDARGRRAGRDRATGARRPARRRPRAHDVRRGRVGDRRPAGRSPRLPGQGRVARRGGAGTAHGGRGRGRPRRLGRAPRRRARRRARRGGAAGARRPVRPGARGARPDGARAGQRRDRAASSCSARRRCATWCRRSSGSCTRPTGSRSSSGPGRRGSGTIPGPSRRDRDTGPWPRDDARRPTLPA